MASLRPRGPRDPVGSSETEPHGLPNLSPMPHLSQCWQPRRRVRRDPAFSSDPGHPGSAPGHDVGAGVILAARPLTLTRAMSGSDTSARSRACGDERRRRCL